MRHRAAAAALALLMGSLAGCSGDDSPERPEPEPEAEVEAAEPAPLATSSKVANVAGRLPKARRDAIDARATKVVDAWLDAAYVGGDFPRSIDDEAWGGFTSAAARKARKDRTITSAAAVSEQVEGVTAVRRVVRHDVFAANGRARGVTARVRLRYETEGSVESTFVVKGRVMLTPASGGWKIFGYDLTQEER